MHSTLSELGYKTYVYLFDIKYFAKTLRDNGYEEDDINLIAKDVEKLYKLFLKAIELKNITEQYDVLTEALTLTGSLLDDFKSVKCEKKFINEKTDLIVETFSISEHLKVILEELLKS
jgi:hypothetical protein